LQRRSVERAAFRLANDRRIRAQPAAVELRQDPLGGAGDVARRVEVLDPHQPDAAMRARVEPRRERGDERAGVQQAGRRWREATDVASARRVHRFHHPPARGGRQRAAPTGSAP
jgi:hypothetical protein